MPQPPSKGPSTPVLPEDPASVTLIYYPDPRLRRRSQPVEGLGGPQAARVRALAERMLQIMREHRGVGLAAPQVGVNLRLFVMNATGEPEDDRIYINPELSEPEGEEEHEEGCLSLPEINTPVWRSQRLRLQALDVEGRPVEETAEGFVPRIWQHEVDHLDGVLILDKMPVTVKLAHRRQIRELEEAYREAHPEPEPPKKKRRFGRRR